jgi:hypothetical protein
MVVTRILGQKFGSSTRLGWATPHSIKMPIKEMRIGKEQGEEIPLTQPQEEGK